MYCEETKVPAYPGSFGDQPNVWIQKFFIIKNAIHIRENRLREKSKQDRKRNIDG